MNSFIPNRFLQESTVIKAPYFKPVNDSNNKVQMIFRKPSFNIENQDYRSILYIMFLESGVPIKELKGKKGLLDKPIFNNTIFLGNEFAFLYKNHKTIKIEAKNLRIGIRLSKPISANNYLKVSTKHVGIKYTGMKLFSSYLGNTQGIPILDQQKILTPDINQEVNIFRYMTKRNKDPYSLTVNNIFELMMKFKCVVWYQGSSSKPKEYFKYFEIKNNIDDYFKPEYEELMRVYSRNKDKDYILVDNWFTSTKEIERYMSEILSIILGRDMEDFKKSQAKARNISKTNVLPNLDKLLKGFYGTAFEHQRIGISWLYGLYKAKLTGAILADDMGMGKTFQSIGFCTTLINERKITKRTDIIIVCPASVVSVWEKEIQSFNPGMIKYTKIYSFEKFQRIHLDIKPIILIVDEAQRAKNKQTTNNKRLQTVNAKFTLLLSGTPIENKTQDLYNILSLVDPVFNKIFNVLNRLSSDEEILATKTASIVDGIYLRRLKTKDQLPSVLNIQEIKIDMNKQETVVHQAILDFYGNSKVKKKATSSLEYYNEFIIALGRLRQTVSHVKQLQDQSFVKTKLTSDTSKMKELHRLIKTHPKDEKFVIFTSYSKTNEFIKKELSTYGKVLVIDGSIPSSKRGNIIKEFQENPDTKYIVVNIKAGNSGITLHAARNIVMYDLWWNPAVMQQAIARVHRIGQVRDVNAYLFINKKSIDENIINIINIKKGIIDAFEGKNTSPNLDKNTVDKLINDIF